MKRMAVFVAAGLVMTACGGGEPAADAGGDQPATQADAAPAAPAVPGGELTTPDWYQIDHDAQTVDIAIIAGLVFLFGVASDRLARSWVTGPMFFAAGGILYLTFEDIAPAAPLKGRWAPPLGAVAGFLLAWVVSTDALGRLMDTVVDSIVADIESGDD